MARTPWPWPRGAALPPEPGYYLISQGRPRLEEEIGYRPSARQRVLRAYVASAALGYLGSIAIVSVFLLCLPLIRTHAADAPLARAPGAGGSGPGARLGSGGGPDQPRRARHLPAAAAPAARAGGRRAVAPQDLVAVPTLLTGEEQIADQIERLEIHYLANADGDLRFALLSDWTDAAAERGPGDDRLLAAAAPASPR